MTLSEIDRLQRSLAGRYELVSRAGKGGTATVYLARDLRHDRSVALKVLLPDVASGVDARRFLQEIRIVARLTHPHILPLLDSGQADGQPYYVMPFIEGASLQERLTNGHRLPVDEALRLGCHV